jgi:DNA-binding NtrC family response regulator
MHERNTKQPSVLVVDDDPDIRLILGRWLSQAGIVHHMAESGQQAMRAVADEIGVACVDLSLGDMSGLDLLRHLRVERPSLQVVVITASRELETAVEAMQAGAFDYVTKPLTRERTMHALDRALIRHRLTRGDVQADRARASGALAAIVGDSAAMRRVGDEIARVAQSDITVCILGESGVGKELVAHAVHNAGPRVKQPFVAVNCASIPETLQESELFGHERGAFTGATHARQGSFERANGGTLFLDELGEMSASTQASLLRTLQERTIRRVGGQRDIRVDVRVVCATHRDLEAEVEAGRFRADLYYRLVVYPISVPPLRERPEDIPLLLGSFLAKLSAAEGRAVSGVTSDALEALTLHNWPGNVRELQNVAHRAVLASDGNELGLADLPAGLRKLVLPALPAAAAPAAAGEVQPPPYVEGDEVLPLKELERRAIAHALRVTAGNVAKAAQLLGVGRATLYRRLASLDVDVPS